MSTEGQHYSLDHQAAAIASFAQNHGYEIIRTYTDAGRSGVTTKHREGLKRLLADVVNGNAPFSTLLVLDVSRWGRFQDPDEAGHYEFLCRSAGVDVRYCAETFEPGLSGSVVKALKRAMAGEYSRELSNKVRHAKDRFALAGNAPGGTTRFGFSRQIIEPDGSLGKVLARGERKQRPEQVVRMIPEGQEQSRTLRMIFRLFVAKQAPPCAIASELNRLGRPWIGGATWTNKRVSDVLRCELVTGRQPYGKTTSRLGAPLIYNDRSTWGMVQVFPPIVPLTTYNRAQRRLAALNGRLVKTDDELIADLRRIHRTHGRISTVLIDHDQWSCVASVYYGRFGTLAEAYRLAGLSYKPRERGRHPDGRRLSRDEVITRLKELHHRHGRISMSLCHADQSLPALGWLRWEFGSLGEAYDAAGISHAHHGGPVRRKEPDAHPSRPKRGEIIVGPLGGRYTITSGGRKRYGG